MYCCHIGRAKRSNQAGAKYAAEAAEQAARHRDKPGIAGKVKDVASVHSTLWPEETHTELIEGAILLGTARVLDADENETGEVEIGPGCERKELT